MWVDRGITAFGRTPTLWSSIRGDHRGHFTRFQAKYHTAHEKRCDNYQRIVQGYSESSNSVPDERCQNRQHEGEPRTQKDGDDCYFGGSGGILQEIPWSVMKDKLVRS